MRTGKAIAAPIPMPAFAPVLRLDGVAGAGVEVEVGRLDEVEVLGEEGLVLGRALWYRLG
jgi:hypothetical protein